MKNLFLFFWITLNVILPPGVQSAYSTQYFDSELDCIDKILTDPAVFYAILAKYDEKSCEDSAHFDAQEIFKLAKTLTANSGVFAKSLSGLNSKIKTNLRTTERAQTKAEVTIFTIDNARRAGHSAKRLDSGVAQSAQSPLRRITDMLQMSLREKVEEMQKKVSIEKKSGDLLSDDKRTFQTLANEDAQKMLDPGVQKKIIEQSLGTSESQKFGDEQRTKGDHAGDLMFQDKWEYSPVEINQFQFELDSLDDVHVEEYKWSMPKKRLENTHKIIERKNYGGKVRVESDKNAKQKETGPDSFSFKPMNFDFSGGGGAMDFGNFGGFDTLEDVQEESHSAHLNFNNQDLIKHQIINQNKHIGDVEIEEMVITDPHTRSEGSLKTPEKSTTSPQVSRKSPSRSTRSPAKADSHKSVVSVESSSASSRVNGSPEVKSRKTAEKSHESPRVSPQKSQKFDFDTMSLDSSTKGDRSQSSGGPKWKKPQIHQEIRDKERRSGHVSIASRSQRTGQSSSPSHESLKSQSRKSSQKTTKSPPVQSPTRKSSETVSHKTFNSIQDHKYKDIEQDSSFSAVDSTPHDNESIMSFKPSLSQQTNPLFDNEELGSEPSTDKSQKTPVVKPKIETNVDVIDGKKKGGSVVIQDRDEDEQSPLRSEESSSVVNVPELDKKKTKRFTDSEPQESSSVIDDNTPKSQSSKHVESESSSSSTHKVTEKTPKSLSPKAPSQRSRSSPVVEESSHTSQPASGNTSSESSNSSRQTLPMKSQASRSSKPADVESEELTFFSDNDSEDSSPPDRFNVNPDDPIESDNLHKKKKKRDQFQGKTIIALQFTRAERALMSVNPRSARQKRREILLLFNLLPSCIKRALLACRPRPEEALERCQKEVPGMACETQNMVAQIACDSDESFFNGACYKSCPEDMKDHPLICMKSISKTRRAQKWHPEKSSLDPETEEIYAGALKVVKCEVFGPSYEAVGPDLCVQKCPYGWRNLGSSCLKPVRFLHQPKVVLEADFE